MSHIEGNIVTISVVLKWVAGWRYFGLELVWSCPPQLPCVRSENKGFPERFLCTIIWTRDNNFPWKIFLPLFYHSFLIWFRSFMNFTSRAIIKTITYLPNACDWSCKPFFLKFYNLTRLTTRAFLKIEPLLVLVSPLLSCSWKCGILYLLSSPSYQGTSSNWLPFL